MSRGASEARGKAAIVGVADAVSPTGSLDSTASRLEALMIREALDDAGLSLSDVDAVFSAGDPMGVVELLRIQPRYTDSTSIGGASFEAHVEHAAAAIALGLCEVAVTVHAQTPRSRRLDMGPMRGRGANPQREWEAPYGLPMPRGAYALAASRHMAQYGTTSQHLAQIAVSTRQWATMNPRARFQEPITIDDVLSSRLVAEPLHLLDCCLVTDGAGAVVLVSAARASDLRKAPAYVLGTGTSLTHRMISQMPELTVTPGAVSGPKAFSMAGIKPDEVDVAMLYDSFTITVLLALEDLGFCPKGEGGPFVEDGKLGPGGSFPTNCNGGGLSYTHPGMYGIFLLVEAVRQLRGESGRRQVEGAQVAVAHGTGGVLSSTSTVVLGTSETL
jgi:acetyl-CoA acetyltransferase